MADGEFERVRLPDRPAGSFVPRSPYTPGTWMHDGRWVPPTRWVGRGVALELGSRAYRYLLVESRDHQWPPALEDWEVICDA